MSTLQRFQRRPEQAITAVQIRLETDGLRYRKWGGEQIAHQGDWLVDNGNDVYTVEQASFAATYTCVQPGRYVKTAPVWAERATQPGRVATKEGHTDYQAGDWLVSNQPDSSDRYAVSADTFARLYTPDLG